MQEYRAQFLTQTLQSLNLDQVIYAGRPSKSVEDMYVPLQLSTSAHLIAVLAPPVTRPTLTNTLTGRLRLAK